MTSWQLTETGSGNETEQNLGKNIIRKKTVAKRDGETCQRLCAADLNKDDYRAILTEI